MILLCGVFRTLLRDIEHLKELISREIEALDANAGYLQRNAHAKLSSDGVRCVLRHMEATLFTVFVYC